MTSSTIKIATGVSNSIRCIWLFSLCHLHLCGPFSFAQSPPLEVSPPEMHLFTGRGQQGFIVRAVCPDGLTRDVTSEAKIALADDKLVNLDKNLLNPLADGPTDLIVQYGGRAVTVPVTISD